VQSTETLCEYITLTKNPHPILQRRGSLLAVFGVVEWLMTISISATVCLNFLFWRDYETPRFSRDLFCVCCVGSIAGSNKAQAKKNSVVEKPTE
jgi:hypothetical protein